MTRVIKIGGRSQNDPSLADVVAMAAKVAPGGLVIVHGGGDEVSTLQTAFGVATEFVNGRRVTTERDIGIVRMVLSGSANKRLVSSFVTHGVLAVGLSGEDGALITATPMDAEQLGLVGVPSGVNVVLLRHLLAGGYLPVISPVSRDDSGTTGSALNVNGDDAASAIAVALGATELLFVADVAGVMCDGVVIPRITRTKAQELVANGTAMGGMLAKLQAGLAAIEGGVSRVRISDIPAIDDLVRGTTLCSGELS